MLKKMSGNDYLEWLADWQGIDRCKYISASKTINPHDSEILACQELVKNGIYAIPGRFYAHFLHVDIVAFGFIPIEVKYSRGKMDVDGNWRFNWLIGTKGRKVINGSIVMLIAQMQGNFEVALYPAHHEIFFDENDALRQSIQYTQNQRADSTAARLSHDVWIAHLNNYGAVREILNYSKPRTGF